jgi:hypothetical protein
MTRCGPSVRVASRATLLEERHVNVADNILSPLRQGFVSDQRFGLVLAWHPSPTAVGSSGLEANWPLAPLCQAEVFIWVLESIYVHIFSNSKQCSNGPAAFPYKR